MKLHRIVPLVSLALMAATPSAAPAPQGSGIPEWFLEEVVDREGVWITDNSAYQEVDGGIEEYGMEWRPGIGGKSLVGRLFGRRGGEDIGTYWEFRMFWHPGLREVRLYQFGSDGTVGIGPAEPPRADGTEVIEQVFTAPDGTESRVRHVSVIEGDREVGRSENWVDGEWQPRREYVWYRQR